MKYVFLLLLYLSGLMTAAEDQLKFDWMRSLHKSHTFYRWDVDPTCFRWSRYTQLKKIDKREALDKKNQGKEVEREK